MLGRVHIVDVARNSNDDNDALAFKNLAVESVTVPWSSLTVSVKFDLKG